MLDYVKNKWKFFTILFVYLVAMLILLRFARGYGLISSTLEIFVILYGPLITIIWYEISDLDKDKALLFVISGLLLANFLKGMKLAEQESILHQLFFGVSSLLVTLAVSALVGFGYEMLKKILKKLKKNRV